MSLGMDRVRVVVVGGGVGALELVLGLHKLAEERVSVTLVAPDHEFRYRPASVAVPFDQGQVLAFPLAEIAEAAGATFLTMDRVARVDVDARIVCTVGGDGALDDDVLVIACGARRLPTMSRARSRSAARTHPAMRGCWKRSRRVASTRWCSRCRAAHLGHYRSMSLPC